jgi:hypothetical protein
MGTYLEFHFVGDAIGEGLEPDAALLLVVESLGNGVLFEIDVVIDGRCTISHLVLLLTRGCLVAGGAEPSSTLVEFVSANNAIIFKKELTSSAFGD